MPLLELDDGTRLTEGPAIVQYLADRAPQKKLAPANGTIERYKLQEWLNFITSELHKQFSPLFDPSMPDDAKAKFRDKIAGSLRLDRGAARRQALPHRRGLHRRGRVSVHGGQLDEVHGHRPRPLACACRLTWRAWRHGPTCRRH